MKAHMTTMAAAVFAITIAVSGSEAEACERGKITRPAVAKRLPCVAAKPVATKSQATRRVAPVSDSLKHSLPTAGRPRCGAVLPLPDQQDIAPPLQFSLPKNWQKQVGGIA